MITLLEEKDIDNCLVLMELVKDDFPGYKENEFIQAMRNAITQKEAFIVYVESEITGLIAFSYKNREIIFLAINPKSRRKGIAKNLIREVINCFHPGDMLHVVTFRNNDSKGKAAIACYRSCGFREGELVEAYGYPCQKMILWL